MTNKQNIQPEIAHPDDVRTIIDRASSGEFARWEAAGVDIADMRPPQEVGGIEQAAVSVDGISQIVRSRRGHSRIFSGF